MQKIRLRRHATRLLMAVVLAMIGVQQVAAITATSDNYQMTEGQFGASAPLESCSGQYCAKASIGDMGTGSSASGSMTASFSEELDGDEPVLEVIVEPGVSNLGDLSSDTTATKTTIVRVRNHLGGGYLLQMTGAPPKFGDHVLATPSVPTLSKPGTEQFAVNVVANTIPSVGANPVQVPADQATFGEATEKYGISNHFAYTSGDTLATSHAESGRTDYTISMIVNISSSTPAGHYSGDFSVVVVPAY